MVSTTHVVRRARWAEVNVRLGEEEGPLTSSQVSESTIRFPGGFEFVT